MTTELSENKTFMSQLIEIIEGVKEEYTKYYIGDEEIECLQLTVGSNGDEHQDGDIKFGCQTGDNSYTGAAYGYRCWGIAYIDDATNSEEAANEIVDQLSDQIAYEIGYHAQ